MRFSLHVNQKQALDLGIKHINQAHIFDLLCSCSAWAKTVVVDGEVYYWVARQAICNELKILNLKPDSVYRHLKKLADLGLIFHVKHGLKDCIKITEKGKLYYVGFESESDDFTMSDLNPKRYVGFESETDQSPMSDLNPKDAPNSDLNPNHYVGFESESNSDLNPTYQTTKNISLKDLSDIYINPNEFNNFFETFPKKIGKAAAEREWLKLSTVDREDAVKNSLVRYADTPYKFVHSPAKYLSEKLWRDELKNKTIKKTASEFGETKRGFLADG